ncbi:hypothetical protein ENUP19_0012G0016 [Entamoeba nuttalli]|uniref:sphingomyelin phosphodiesterase n=2 Tax=Entamoeba nuttalli TaxID=412467 RepID=K2GJ02_ENTNP|nr:endonuclease/exonuclease/phosphatase domain containing protein [Entamoeba nuttalli P19]EKE42666.1 endonuclease/exonuclease/phosphatase domain containing protein [Entamoeba nuttalli P19]|eukprot:XP_008855001.1 endonuclease/exonuclease/phosphatase domain containing protein [Entamoeba nuttalli P19]
MTTKLDFNMFLTPKVYISLAVIVSVIIILFIAIFVFQCYHRNCFITLKEILIESDYSMQQINVLSYNLCMRAPLISNEGDDFKNVRLDLFIKNVLEHFDIIFLQDVIGAYSARRAHLIECAYEKGLTHSLVSLTPILPCFICDGGLLILSRIPLKDRDQYIFKSRIYPESILSRGILYSKIQPNESTTLHIFNTQLQSISNNPLVNQVRLNQLDELVKFILSKTSKDEYPILICGDFSINALAKAETIIDETFWESGETEESEMKDSIKYIEEQTDEYVQLIDKLSDIGIVKDIIYNGLHRHPITTGDTYFDNNKELPLETVLTKKEDQLSKRCEDYIFLIIRSKELEIVNPYIHTYDVNNDNFNFLSSHYGLSCVINC